VARNHVDGGLLTQLPSPVYIGIDPSLTGFALTVIAAKSDHFESWVYTSEHRGIERLIDISNWLSEKYSTITDAGHHPLNIAIESGVFHSQSAAVLGELAAVVKLWCYQNMPFDHRFPLMVPPTVVKKYATDKGTAKKSEVMLAVYKRWGVEFSDDNMADSYVIARIARGGWDTASQRESIEKMQDPKFRDAARV
jgi:crossover junction endodeoxyribonuclease RuvC